jgi:hypothetical protein
MPESDHPLDLLYAVRDVGVAPLRVAALRAQVQTAVRREIEREANRPAVAGGRAPRRGRRPTFGALATALSVLIAIAIAATAITLLSHARGPTRSGGSTTGQLIAKLAVLRRPQTRADLLPGRLHIRSPLSPPGRVIPRLTRLVRTLPDARLYLVVTTWSPDSTWSPRLGDQVSIVTVRGRHAAGTVPIPAADLTNANEVSLISPTDQQSPTTPGLYHVGIVADGVARVRWTFANRQFQPGAVVNTPASNNVAVSQGPLDTFPVPLRAAWYAADSHRIPTSNNALLASQAARDATQEAQLIRTVLEHPYDADPSLLTAFAVFAITSSTGVKTAAGDIISRPPLSAIPLDVLQGYARPDGKLQLQLDFNEVRQVITPSGVHMYVIPGTRGLCLVSGDSSSPFPDGILAGGGAGGCNTLPDVESHGISFSSGSLGIARTYEIVPKTIHSIMIRNIHGTRTTIPVPDGIYVSSAERRRTSGPCRAARQAGAGIPNRCLPRPR